MKNWMRFGVCLTAGAFLAAVWMALCVGRVDFGAKVMLGVCAAGLAVMAAALGLSLWMNAYADSRAAQDADANWAVVFGAGVKDETPSLLLTLRTRAAFEYLLAHPDTRAVLTGGVGSDAAISEAEAMRRLLEGWGIAADRLVCEDRARNTAENARYAMELIGDPEASVVSVSNAFHQYRCIKELTLSGARSVMTRNAPLPSVGVAVSMYLRECCAIVYHAVFG